MALPELRDALQSAAFGPGQKVFLLWLFSSGLEAALQEGSGLSIAFDEDAGTFTFSVAGGDRVQVLQYQVGDETTTITTGTAKSRWRLPFRFHITEVRSSVGAASSSGPVTVDINIDGVSILGTNKLSIDAGEKTSATAATAVDFDEDTFEDDSEVTVDIDAAGTNAAGLKVYLIGYVQLDDVERITEDGETRITEDGETRILES